MSTTACTRETDRALSSVYSEGYNSKIVTSDARMPSGHRTTGELSQRQRGEGPDIDESMAPTLGADDHVNVNVEDLDYVEGCVINVEGCMHGILSTRTVRTKVRPPTFVVALHTSGRGAC